MIKNEIKEIEEMIYLLKRMIEINMEYINKQKEEKEKFEKMAIETRKNVLSEKAEIAIGSHARARNDTFILRKHFTSVERKIINKLAKKSHIKKLIDLHGTKAIYKEMMKEHKQAKENFIY